MEFKRGASSRNACVRCPPLRRQRGLGYKKRYMSGWIPSIIAISSAGLSTLGALSAQADPGLMSLDDAPQSRIYGGQITKTCEFPQTVSVGGCTGTLVHPRVVLSAAHCGSLRSASFGEHSRSAVARKASFKWCERSDGTRDSQICVLKEAITDIPVVPIAQGCELDEIKKGSMVLLSGFGYDENDPKGGSPGGEKRWVETDIRVVKDNLDIHIGGDGKGGCNGDSGGPAFLKMKDGTWRTIGATHAGATPNGAHPTCDTGIWKSTGKLMKWYEEQLKKHGESDIDLSPCFDDDGKWAPNEHCGGYVKDLKGPFGTWEDGCGKDAPVVKYSATCGEPFAPNEEDPGGGKNSGESGSISFVSPKDKSSIVEGESLTVEVKLSDIDEAEEVVLLVNDKEQSADDEAPYRWTLDDLSVGSYELRALARDEDGKTLKESKAIEVDVMSEGESSSDPSGGESGAGSGGGDSGKPKNTPELSKEEPDSSKNAASPDNASGKGDSSGEPEKGGSSSCRIDAQDKAWGWGLFGLLTLLGIRRRSR